jgi:uncharacterized protein (TIGR02145 family)
MCLTGTFTHKDCSGKPKNNCPYGSPKGCSGSVFSSSVSFCYDGNVYQKCSGMEYNPTTHICEGYVANPARCNGTQYNPLEQGCCGSAIYNLANQRCWNNVVETKCETGNNYHNPQTQFCNGNEVLDKCGGSAYNPENQRCQSNTVETKCGTNWYSDYNPATQFCSGNNVYSKCNGSAYNPETQRCQNGVVETKCGTSWYDATNADLWCLSNVVQTKCGTGWYNTATQVCEGGKVFNKCGGDVYDSSTKFCQSGTNAVLPLCGTQTYTSSQFCQSANVVKSLCGTETYLATQFCQSDTNAILPLCGTQTYTSNQRCEDNVVETKCGTGSYYYKSETQFCSDNNVYNKCNGSAYNPETQRCQSNTVETKCGTSWYDATNADLWCLSNVVQTKCGTGWYNTATQFCQSDNVVKYLCGTETYTSSQYCKNGTTPTQYGSETYAGQTYNIIVIGTQTWMAENLNYNATGSKCYNNQESNCNIYGRLYDWATAMGLASTCNSSTCAGQVETPHQGICPSGWHIPSNEDWDVLVKYVDPDYVSSTVNVAGTKLKATSWWNINGYDLDSYGFSALLGGFYFDHNDLFHSIGNSGYWWSASEYGSDNTYCLYMNNDEYASWGIYTRRSLLSVRCLQD